MKQAVRGTWNFGGKPAALAQGCASEAHLKHGCEYVPVAGRIRNFIEILSALAGLLWHPPPSDNADILSKQAERQSTTSKMRI